jgi:TetR/AcrR family transcriptional regulator, transcriptional repressor of bet genes
MGRPTNTTERRAQIAAGLLAVMAKHGYDGASIGDIARRARVASGIVHYHFANKLEILVEAVRALAAEHGREIEAALRELADPRAQLAALIDLHLDLKHADPARLSCWIQIAGEALRHAPVRVELEVSLAALAERFTAIIERGVETRAFACTDPRAAAAALTATIQGYFVLGATTTTIIPRGTAAASTKRMADALVQPRPRVR